MRAFGAAGIRPAHRCPHGHARRAPAVRRGGILFGSVLLAAGLAQPAAAQETQRSVQDYISEQSAIIERFSPPPAKGSVTVAVLALDKLPAGFDPAQEISLAGIDVEGVTQIDGASLPPLWADLLGRTITLADLIGLTERIDRFYYQQGLFARSVIPLQDFSTGHARVLVDDEGYIAKVTITGDAARMAPRLDRYIRRLVDMRPLRVKEVERILLLMSDMSGMDITAKLNPPDTIGGGGAMDFQLDFHPVQARASLENYGSEDVGPLMLIGSLQVNDLLGALEGSRLTAVTVPNANRELRFISLAQEFPVAYDGLALGYELALAGSQPGGDAKDLGLSIRSVESRVHASYPFLRTIAHSVTGTLAVNAQDSSVAVDGVTLVQDDYRWLSIEGEAEHDLGFADLDVGVEFRQGLGIFGATGEGASRASQGSVAPGFRSARAGADLFVDLSDEIRLLGSGIGQYAFSNLPSMVEMRYGGDPFGRAFGASVKTADTGFAGLLQISHDLDLGSRHVRNAAAIGYFDYALLHRRNARPGDGSHALSSGGIGFSAVLAGGFYTEMFLAMPIKTDASVDDQGSRLLFAVRKRF